MITNVLSSVALMTIHYCCPSSEKFDVDNTIGLNFQIWFHEKPESEPKTSTITSSEQYMGYPVGYTGPVYN